MLDHQMTGEIPFNWSWISFKGQYPHHPGITTRPIFREGKAVAVSGLPAYHQKKPKQNCQDANQKPRSLGERTRAAHDENDLLNEMAIFCALVSHRRKAITSSSGLHNRYFRSGRGVYIIALRETGRSRGVGRRNLAERTIFSAECWALRRGPLALG